MNTAILPKPKTKTGTGESTTHEALRQQAAEILRTEIDFIPNQEFRNDDAGCNEEISKIEEM